MSNRNAYLLGRVRDRGGKVAVETQEATIFDFTTGVLNPLLTFSRSSTANYLDVNGLLVSAAVDAPRFDYDYTQPGNPVFRGLLIEPSTTNELLFCRDLTNAVWVPVNATAALTQTGIDGAANSATLVAATLAAGNIRQTVTEPTVIRRVFSFYAKRVVGAGAVTISPDNGVTTLNIGPLINASTWTRVNISPSVDIANPICSITFATSGDSIIVDYSQEEINAEATSPLLTVGAVSTRSADNCQSSAASLDQWYKQNTSGSFVASYILPNGSALTQLRSVVSVGTSTNGQDENAIYADFAVDTNPRGRTTLAGAAQANIIGTLMAAKAQIRFGYRFENNNFNGAENGVLLTPDFAGTLAAAQTRCRFGSRGAGTALLNGWLQKVLYVSPGLSDAQLVALTT